MKPARYQLLPDKFSDVMEVIDTRRVGRFEGYHSMCTCGDQDDAQNIVDALNATMPEEAVE